jgi:hypothetical protein
MFFFKSCTRCKGDMRFETDELGHGFVHCLSCGYMLDIPRERGRQISRANGENAFGVRRAS